ncbi:MAG TPA: hypothetical protein VJ874_02570 [Candidatus Thermoplasmatota archaeon]|nr:hypothetical protein [Candidatus Thermoplasmatota archaeon]
MKGAAVVGMVAVSAVLLPGCLEPFQVHVPDEVLLEACRLPSGRSCWVVTPGGVSGDALGPKSRETRYALDRDPDGPPPFSGSLQVFSIRSVSRLDSEDLLDLARDLVDRGAVDQAIVLSEGETSGRRTLESGVPTSWFAREGRTAQSGDLFEQDVGVRILGEVGHDGRSDTSLLVIAMAQVSRTNQCPILVNCQPQESNLQTWIQMVGDRDGTIQGTTSQSGFIANLVTR